MPSGLGAISKCGIVYMTAPDTWGAAWSAVSSLVPFTRESITSEWQRIQDLNLTGSPGKKESAKGPLVVRGELEGELDYYNFEYILRAAMGSSSGGVYSLTDTLQSNEHCLRIEFEKGVSRWRIGSAKINRMRIWGRSGEALKINLELFCRDITQSATAFPSLSFSNYKKITWEDTGSVSHAIADLVDAMAIADDKEYTAFEIELDNNLAPPEHDSENYLYAMEPIRNGFRSVKMKVELPRYIDDTFVDFKNNDTALQSTFQFSNGGKTFAVRTPEMKIVSGADMNIDGPGLIKPEVQFECFRNANNSHLSTVTEEFDIVYT